MVKEKQILSKGKDIIRRFVGYVLFVFIPCFSRKRQKNFEKVVNTRLPPHTLLNYFRDMRQVRQYLCFQKFIYFDTILFEKTKTDIYFEGLTRKENI